MSDNIPPRSVYVLITDEKGGAMLGTVVSLSARDFGHLTRLHAAREPWWNWLPFIGSVFSLATRRQLRLLAKPPVRFPAAPAA